MHNLEEQLWETFMTHDWRQWVYDRGHVVESTYSLFPVTEEEESQKITNHLNILARAREERKYRDGD